MAVAPGSEQSYARNTIHVQRALEVAAALDLAAGDPSASTSGAEAASGPAETVRMEANAADRDRIRLRELVFQAATSVVGALGSAADADIAAMASNALGSFG